MRILFCLAALLFSFSSLAVTSVEYIQRNAFPVATETPVLVVEQLSQKRLILVGEVHGTNEMPAHALLLLKALSKK